MAQTDLIRQMAEKAQGVQAVVSTIKNFAEACRYTVDLTRSQGGRTIAAPGLSAAERDHLANHCDKAGLTLLAAPLRAHADRIHTALTYADWGIAETGTLVLDSRSEDLRIATMLAETHVAILPAESIQPEAGSIADKVNALLQTDAPAYTTFITGASRTADIERVLAIGVHGPQELHILIREETTG